MSSGSSTGIPAPAPYFTSTTVPLGLNIEIIWDSSVASAPAGFVTDVEQVANLYASALQPTASNTPITIDVGYGEINGSRIGGSALGESETNLQQVSYTQLTSAYATADAHAGTDLTTNNFPNSAPTGKFYVSDAEAQALGITIINPPKVDGYIGFSSQNGIFDYNTSDGVSAKQYDFSGTVAHEISEVLGRIFLGNNQISAYDFFHYSSAGVHDFAPNGGYFSINGGATDLANFNAGRGGDGSDWGTGGTTISGGSAFDSFNAFGTPGQISPVTQTDLTALQSLGFELSPAAIAGNLTPSTQTTVQNTQKTATVTSDAFHFGPSANVAPQTEPDATNLNHTAPAAEQLASLVSINAHVDVALAHLDTITPADTNDAQALHVVQNHFLLH